MPLSPLPLQLHTMHNFLPDASADALPASFLFSVSFFAAFLAIYFATQHAQPDAYTHTQRHIRRHAHTDNEAHTHIYKYTNSVCASFLCFNFVVVAAAAAFCLLFRHGVPLTHCTVPSDGREREREREGKKERSFSLFLLNLPLLSCSGFAWVLFCFCFCFCISCYWHVDRKNSGIPCCYPLVPSMNLSIWFHMHKISVL